MDDSKALFDYWHGRVQLTNRQLIENNGHIPTQELRHKCTNYDTLRFSNQVQALGEPERSRIIAIIKYECTAKVLQERAGRLRDRASQLEDANKEISQEKSKLLRIIKVLQEKLFGKDQDVKKLENRVAALEAENEVLRTEAETSKVYADLLAEFEQLKKQYEVVEKRKRELAKNNQSLGGRVAHTNRFRQQRDDARVLVEEQKQQILTLSAENQRLIQENVRLSSVLEKLQKQNKLEVGKLESHEI